VALGPVLLLELRLERRQFGERRVGIRFFVLPAAAPERLGIILLALGALDLRTALAAGAARPPIDARGIAFVFALLPLLPLAARVAFAALLPVRTVFPLGLR